MKIKCIVCDRRIKPKPKAHNQKVCSECRQEHRKDKDREYYEKNKERRRQYNREYYEKNKDILRQHHREHHQRHKERYRLYNREYYERHKETLRLIHRLGRTPFDHFHDRSTHLNIVNGRVKGAVWLERQIWRRSFFQRHHENDLCACSSLQTPFFVVVENNSLYCVECGGRIIKAFENDYYSKFELCCDFCGLVVPPVFKP